MTSPLRRGVRNVRRSFELVSILGFRKSLLVVLEGYFNLNPDSAKSRWYRGIPYEVIHWKRWLEGEGLDRTDVYLDRTNPDLALQANVLGLLPEVGAVSILDVGSGPLTTLGKKSPGRLVHITAVDPLADEWNMIMNRLGVVPPVRPRKAVAEQLTSCFAPDTFDLVYSRNAIDHSSAPEQAILQMISVVKPRCYVLMEHKVNEGENEGYSGLHQWNFSTNQTGDFVIRSRESAEINITRKYVRLCSVVCEIKTVSSPHSKQQTWLTTKIKKRAAECC